MLGKIRGIIFFSLEDHPWTCKWLITINRILFRGVVIPLIFPKVPLSSLGILRIPQLHPPLENPPLKNPITVSKWLIAIVHKSPKDRVVPLPNSLPFHGI